jgi:ATP-binding cassette, subfamily C (CFTR/MRP), member 1
LFIWKSVTKKRPNSLLVVAFGSLKWPLLAVITPRACLIALNFCQPFLINRAIKLSEEPITEATTKIGYGLIGAYVFVYVGIAVCSSRILGELFLVLTTGA